MVPVDYHSSTGLNAGNSCFKNEDQGRHPKSQPPESAMFTTDKVKRGWLECEPVTRGCSMVTTSRGRVLEGGLAVVEGGVATRGGMVDKSSSRVRRIGASERGTGRSEDAL